MRIGGVDRKARTGSSGRKMAGGLVFVIFVAVFSGAANLAAEEIITVDAFPRLRFRAENVITLPPGDITGTIYRSDGTTPYAQMKVALVGPESGEEIVSTLTDENGLYAFEDVPEGRYVVVVGNPGTVTILDVAAGANPANMDFAVPRASVFPIPAWAPSWAQAYPGLAYTVAGAGLAGLGVAYYRYNIRQTGRRRVLSPVMP